MTTRQRSLLDTYLAAGGIVGPVQFAILFTILGLLRPGYSPADQAISDLGIADNAWVLNLSLVVLGALLIGLSAAFYRVLSGTGAQVLRLSAAGSLALVGVGYAVAGTFPETNPVHYLVGATLIYVGAPLGFLLAGVVFVRASGRWRAWGLYSFGSAFATVVLVALTFWVFSSYTFVQGATPVGRYGGLMERLLFVEILAWYVAVGWRFTTTGMQRN
jgi:hypothetical membrane protein